MIFISTNSLLKTIFIFAIVIVGFARSFAQKDSSFYSKAFETERWYRIYLPSDYEANPDKEYPVVYYFHGWSGRYKWDEYDMSADPFYPGNGRKNPPFVMEWLDYSQNHDVIIVTWDGYEPNLHPGNKTREGIKYGNCQPYDYPRAHETNPVHWGWDYKMYFRDLVAHIDSNYNTIADRDHRAITGLSMGGLESVYITGQNKDLVGSLSAFCPADVASMFGPKGHLTLFPVPEMYRSLKGIPMRLTATDGDWLHAHDMFLKRIFEGSGFKSFEFHEADFPDHWAADIDKQLDFHMNEFKKLHPKPDNWSHICPTYLNFDQWGYNFKINRNVNALTIVENVSEKHLKVFSRTFIPDGPIVSDETISVITDTLYSPSTPFSLNIYNLTDCSFTTQTGTSTTDGELKFSLPGGGNIVGIHTEKMNSGADLIVLNKQNSEYLYFEKGKQYFLDFTLVNVGNQNANNITVKAISDHPYITFYNNTDEIQEIASSTSIQSDSAISLSFTEYNKENLAGNIMLELSYNGAVVDTQKIVFFAIPESPYVSGNDVIVLDGRSESAVPVFSQCNNSVGKVTLSGGIGNGNGIPEKGEDVLIYVKLAQGLSPNDKNSFHRTYLIGQYEDSMVSLEKLKYDEKHCQAGATSISSYITIGDANQDSINLWLRLESLYNENKPESRRETYEFHYDYRRVKLATSGEGVKYSINTNVVGSGSILVSPADSLFNIGQEVTLHAVPDSGWIFAGWWGDFLGSTNPYSLTVKGDVSAIAYFNEKPTSISANGNKFKVSVSPNPFSDSIVFSYNSINREKTSLTIFNLQGDQIKRLNNKVENPGFHTVEWDGTDSNHNSCPSGIYFYHLSIAGQNIIRKIIKI